jgi:hypothetical protein
MAEFPENVPTLDPTGAPKCKPPLWKRARAWTIIVLIYAIILGMAAGAVPLLRSVFRSGVAPDDRLMHLVWAAMLLAPLGFMVRYFVRVRLKTGRWRGTPEQRQQDRAQRLAKCSIESKGKRVCAANQNSLETYAVKWASYTAFAPEGTPWQRTAAWLVLAAYTLAVLAIAAIGIISFGAAFDNSNTVTATLLFIGLGLACLIWPGIVARRLVRGIRAGKVGTTREELDELRAQRAAWATRESQKPLRTKVMTTVFAAAVYGLWWMRVTVHRAQHPRESWVTPAILTPFLFYSIWVQFRRPRGSS